MRSPDHTPLLQVLLCGGGVAVIFIAARPVLAGVVAGAAFSLALVVHWVGRWRQRVAKCEHGTKGAALLPSTCPQCVEWRVQRERTLAAEEVRRAADLLARKQLLLDKIKTLGFLQQLDPDDFQTLIWALCRKLGFTVEATPFTKDGGSDGFLTKGSERLVLQVKRYKGDVGEPIVRDLFGTLVHNEASGAWLVTTGRISDPARLFAAGKNIRLTDGRDLLAVVAEAQLTADLVPDGFAQPTDAPRVLGNVCPKCGSKLRRVRGRYGRFWGCTSYPACRYTR